MPYILLLIGLLIVGVALYRFMLRATVKEVFSLFAVIAVLVLSGALFLLAVTGRLPAAIAIVGAVWPLALGWWRTQKKKQARADGGAGGQDTTRAAALEIGRAHV